jgi:hypothetical protein
LNATEENHPPVRKRVGLAAKFLLVVTSLFAALCILETVLSLRYDRAIESQKDNHVPFYPWSLHTRDGEKIGTRHGYLKLTLDPYVGYRNLPGQETPYFTINRDGFRGREVPREKGEKKRIIVLGGSTAFGTGLENDGQTFAAHLERILEGAEVINAAVIGHHSKQELIYILSELIEWRPDLIIAIDGWNDWEFNSEDSGLFIHQQEAMLKISTALTTAHWTDRVKRLPQILFPATSRYVFERFWPGGAKDLEEKDPMEVREDYAQNVIRMDRVARAFGSAFLCVMQVDQSDNAVNMHKQEGNGYGDFCDHAAGRFSESGVEWMDMNGMRNRFADAMFMDRVHLTSEGYRIMARAVAVRIRERSLLEGPPR